MYNIICIVERSLSPVWRTYGRTGVIVLRENRVFKICVLRGETTNFTGFHARPQSVIQQ